MKILDYIKISTSMIVLFIAIFGVSCDEEEGSKEIVVHEVFLQSVENPDSLVTAAGTGQLIRISGEGFSTLRAVYCNGIEATVNPTYVTETSILFYIPSEVPAGINADEEVRNTIRLVTDYDDYSFTFEIHSSRPAANSDSYKVGVGKPLTVAAEEGVLANDTDAEDDLLTAILNTTTAHGDITLNADGSFTYVPAADFEGTDRFTYYANDGMINSSSPGTVEITVSNSSLVSGVSHTLPKAGETIVIYGVDFLDVIRIVFPGDVESTDFSVNEAGTEITCVVPSGVGKGAILVEGSAGSAYSYTYMFRDECKIVNWDWGQGYGGSFGAVSALSGTMSSAIPVGGNPSNPAGYRYGPNTAPPSTTTLPVSDDAAFGFNFNPATAANALISNTGGLITGSTKCSELAMQMDFYISAPWGSGYFQTNLKPGDDTYSGNFAPEWVTRGGGGDITMTGWYTATLPLGNIPALQSQTLDHFSSALTSNGTFVFMNNDFTLNGTNYTAKAINNFQVFMGNFRIVPYVKPD